MGVTKHDGLAIPGKVVLAYELPFSLGAAFIDPPMRQVQHNGRSQTIEPRVMEVLVALAQAGGQIVTRDELIERCWDGRIVGDDAINRALSRVRQVASTIGDGSFAVETVARVGYRLLVATGRSTATVRAPGPATSQLATSRRRFIAAASAGAIVIAAAGVVWQRPWRHRPIAEAEQLYRRGALLSREGLPGQVRQAVSYFERAAAVDPKYADAWGAMALSYSHLLEGYDEAELASLPERIRAAAQRALELDSDNADAQLALIFITPYFRNWARKETVLRRLLERHPRHWLAHARLGVLLYQVGRLSEGMEHHRQALQIEPMLPIPYFYLIRNLSALGRAQEAEALIDEAHDRWPAHPALWYAKFYHLLFSGRARSAAAFAMDPESLPSSFAPGQVELLLVLARAVETQRPPDVEESLANQLRMAGEDVASIAVAAPVFAALGRPDLTLASLDRYYFNRGSFGRPSPIGPYTRRYTDFLFTSPMAAMRADFRFAPLLQEIGLKTYWEQTGTAPDYRRGSPF